MDKKENSTKYTNRDKFDNILAYIPLLNIFLLFIETDVIKIKDRRYIRQGVALFCLYVIGMVVLSIISFWLGAIFGIAYFIAIVFFAVNAYNGQYIEIGFIESLIAKFVKTHKVNKQQDDDFEL